MSQDHTYSPVSAMCSPPRGHMRKEVVRNGVSLIPQLADSTAEIDGVPVYDCRRDQAEAGGAEALALEGAVADLALQDCESRFLWEIWCLAIDAQTFVCESRRAQRPAGQSAPRRGLSPHLRGCHSP